MIIGMDEVGTGAWAGPLMVGAVATPDQAPWFWAEITDSKAITKDYRAEMFDMLQFSGVQWAVGQASAAEIDLLGQNRAKRRAAQRALLNLQAQLKDPILEILLDGNNQWGLTDKQDPNNEPQWKVDTLVKGDLLVKEIGAASICAKVTRDRFMAFLAEKPGLDVYKWNHNAGYGTDYHRSALLEFGVTEYHRHSVRPIREMLEDGG